MKPSTWLPLVCGSAFLLCTSTLLAKERDEFHRTIPAQGRTTLNLDNINGSVKILSWDKNEVQVDAVKEADNAAQLEKISVEVTTEGEKVSVKTKYADKKNKGSVDYTIHVPSRTDLPKVKTVNGSIKVQGVTGTISLNTVNGSIHASGVSDSADLSTVNGSVSAQFDKVDSAKAVDLKTVNGSVQTELPKRSNGHFNANTVNGSIHSDFPIQIKKRFPVGADIDADLGQGGPKFQMKTVNGSIKIKQT